VVARPDDLKGSAIIAFVTLEGGRTPTDALKEELRRHVTKEIGALARPDEIRFADMCQKHVQEKSCDVCCAKSLPAAQSRRCYDA